MGDVIVRSVHELFLKNLAALAFVQEPCVAADVNAGH